MNPDSMLGRVFASCGDDEQAEFLNAAGREARRTWTGVGYDMQIGRIVDRLDGDGRTLVKRLAEFIASDEEAPRVIKRVVYEDEIVPRIVEPEDAP